MPVVETIVAATKAAAKAVAETAKKVKEVSQVSTKTSRPFAAEIAQKMGDQPVSSPTVCRDTQGSMPQRPNLDKGFRLHEMSEPKELAPHRTPDAIESLRGKLEGMKTDLPSPPSTENAKGVRSETGKSAETNAPVEKRPPETPSESGEQPNHPEALNGTDDRGECKRTPQNDGHWDGEDGNSKWKPNPDYVPRKNNPEGKTWKEILDREGVDGIQFNEGEPDFSEVAEETVQIDDFGLDRNDNFTQADEKLAEKWNKEAKDGKTDWTPQDIRKYRQENNLTWHERSDMKTMDLVPADIHGNIPHSGGISAAKHLPQAPASIDQAILA